MARIKKVYIVSGLDFNDGNTPISDWRLLHRALWFNGASKTRN